ncbi:hypothetical protein MCHI_000204 [Candidatus Magnetoovum chiemensis]|nr:hypothetical protein MCHI_000204 [Candidatus Magnetoovum chiemensis]
MFGRNLGLLVRDGLLLCRSWILPHRSLERGDPIRAIATRCFRLMCLTVLLLLWSQPIRADLDLRL